MTRNKDLTFYFGAASGTDRRVLRTHGETNVIINYATSNNKPWDGIENLFIDSGGYSRLVKGNDYETSDEDYIRYIKDVDPDMYALRDYPIDSEIMQNKSFDVKEMQHKTIDAHLSILDLHHKYEVDARPVAVLHGKSIEDYLDMVVMMEEAGILDCVYHLGIGGCKEYTSRELGELYKSVCEVAPKYKKLHAFGLNVSNLSNATILKHIDSADSQSYSYRGRYIDEHRDGHISRFMAVSNAYTTDKIRLVDIFERPKKQLQTGLFETGLMNECVLEKRRDIISFRLERLREELDEYGLYECCCEECFSYHNEITWESSPLSDCLCPYSPLTVHS